MSTITMASSSFSQQRRHQQQSLRQSPRDVAAAAAAAPARQDNQEEASVVSKNGPVAETPLRGSMASMWAPAPSSTSSSSPLYTQSDITIATTRLASTSIHGASQSSSPSRWAPSPSASIQSSPTSASSAATAATAAAPATAKPSTSPSGSWSSRWAPRPEPQPSSPATASAPAAALAAPPLAAPAPAPSAPAPAEVPPPPSAAAAAAPAVPPPSAQDATATAATDMGAKSNPAAHLGTELDFMALISSPSRGVQGYEVSSIPGLSKEDQDLTNFATQAKYRLYISRRIHRHCLKHPLALADYSPRLSLPSSTTEEESAPEDKAHSARITAARASLEEIMLLVRKLREGIAASHREDEATIEVYHLSLFLALVTLNKAQLSSTLQRLVLDLYPRIACTAAAATATATATTTTTAWPSSLSRDFSSVQVSCQVSSMLGLFEDSPECRSHSASLLLLSHTCLSDPASIAKAFQDDFMTLRMKVMEALQTLPGNAHIKLATRVEQARKDVNVHVLRRILAAAKGQDNGNGTTTTTTAKASATPYQRVLIYQLVPQVRTTAAARVRKVYPTYKSLSLLPTAASSESSSSSTTTIDGNPWLQQVLLAEATLV